MPEAVKFMFCRLQPGARKLHMLTFLFAAFFTIGLAVLINALQPYLLTNFIGVNYLEQGSVAGRATAIAEVVLITGALIWGVASDRIGRRTVYMIGAIALGLGFSLMPLASTTTQLYAIRCVYAVGMSACAGMLATLVGDYIENEDRGKANGWMGLANAFGAAICASLLAKMPTWFSNAGQDAITAGWSTYLSVGAFCAVAAIVLRLGLGGPETQRASEEHAVPFAQRVKEGIQAGREDFGTGLSYLTAFVARADLAIAGVFLPQWAVSYLIFQNPEAATNDALREELTRQGVAHGGTYFIAIGSASLVAAPFFGFLCDRINRVNAVVIALLLNCVAYGATYFVSDPFSPVLYGVVALIGAGEIGGVISTQVFVQQQAPAHNRGSVIGMFSMWGAIGIGANALIGGELFQRWMFQGPFLWLAALNLVIATIVLVTKGRIKEPDAQSLGSGAALAAH